MNLTKGHRKVSLTFFMEVNMKSNNLSLIIKPKIMSFPQEDTARKECAVSLFF